MFTPLKNSKNAAEIVSALVRHHRGQFDEILSLMETDSLPVSAVLQRLKRVEKTLKCLRYAGVE